MATDKRMFVNGKLVVAEAEVAELAAPSTPGKAGKAEPADMTPAKVASGPRSLEALTASQSFLAISLPNCPQCEELAAALASRGVSQEAAFVKWSKDSEEYPTLKAAMQRFAGQAFSFPQVFVDGSYQGGFAEVLPKLEAGLYDHVLEQQFAAKPITVQRWVNRQPMIVFSLPNCPQCDELKELLKARRLPVDEIFMKWDKAMPQYQTLKAQLVKLIGLTSFTFPQTFVRSEYQGSFTEMAVKLKEGKFDDFFAEAFGVEAPLPVAPMVATPAASIAFDDDF